MKKENIIAIILVLILVGCVGYAYKTRSEEVEGMPCYKSFRGNTSIPFCSDLKNCLNDCNEFGGKYFSLKQRSSGIICYCDFEGRITNIW